MRWSIFKLDVNNVLLFKIQVSYSIPSVHAWNAGECMCVCVLVCALVSVYKRAMKRNDDYKYMIRLYVHWSINIFTHRNNEL